MESPLSYEMLYEYTKYWYAILRLSFATGLVVFVSRLIWKWRNFVYLVSKLPSWKLRYYHFLGHMQLNIYLRTFKNLPFPYHVYDFINMNGYSFTFKNHSLASLWMGFMHVVQVHRADSVETILSSSTELEKASLYRFTHPWLGNGLLTSTGTHWKDRRKLLTPAFHFNILKDFVPVFNNQAKILVDVLSNHTAKEFVEITPFMTKCSFDIICETILGVNMQSQTTSSCPYLTSVSFLTRTIFERMMNILLWPDFIFKRTALGKEFFNHRKLVHDFAHQLIKEKKEKRLLATYVDTNYDESIDGGCYGARHRRAFLDLLLDEHMKNNSLSEMDIKDEVNTFTFEGHDTTAMALCWTLYLIGLHPGVQETVHQELDSIFGDTDRDITPDDVTKMKYLECVLKESLRLYPSVPYFGRQLNKDVEFQGLVVPKGSTCMVFPYFLHRDSEVFPNPEKFDPERFYPENSVGRHSFAYIPFSAGPRNCIGQKFALMEEKVVIATVLRKFRLRSLDPRDKIHVVNELVLRPVEKLRIEIRLRSDKSDKPATHFYYT